MATPWKLIAGLTCIAGSVAFLLGAGDAPKAADPKVAANSGTKKSGAALDGNATEAETGNHLSDDEDADSHASDAKTSDAKTVDAKTVDAGETAEVKKPKAGSNGHPIPGKFIVSSHTNFNVVPSGVIEFGGKGKAGDKVLVMVDGKPAMKGTIKPDGRWKFPIKVKKPGGRILSAKNITNGETVSVKLKLK